MHTFPILKGIHEDLFFDTLSIHSCGLVQIVGWQRHRSVVPLSLLALSINGVPRTLLQMYRYDRRDVPDLLPSGICLEFNLGFENIRSVELLWDGFEIFKMEGGAIQCEEPHFANLRFTPQVLGRDDIYGFGPPNPGVHPEVAAIALQLKPPVLDFGCGIGALVRLLQSTGIQSYGIEIDRPPIREGLPEETRPHVTLYDGKLPTPYADKSFASVVCSEVLEHVVDYEATLGEITRICRETVFLTVPDISAIPLLHKHNVVPWHLLESTHLNFFNQTSFSALLKRYFRSVSFYRLAKRSINGTEYGVSLAAICSVDQ